MSKELEALERIRKNSYLTYLFISYEKELDIIEKALKALEIIKEKEVNIFIFSHSKDLEDYNCLIRRKITQQEYDLLKEVLL